LFGVVQNADSETPADGAKVILEYTEYRVEANKLTMVPFRREAMVPASGRFKICGLPGDLTGSLTAIRGRDSTASIGVRIPSLVGTAGLDLPEVGASATKRVAKVSGLVLDPSGVPLLRARVSILGDSGIAYTDASGRFTMQNLASGTRMLTVRRLGFEPAQLPVVLRAQEPVDVEVRLARPAVQLDTVRVIARRDAALARVGFEDRKRKGVGYFLGPQDIASRSMYDIATLLANAPMLRRVNDNGKTVLTGRGYGTGGCVTYYVDGNIWLGEGVEDFIQPADLAAVEVYSNVNAPAEFQNGMSSCEIVVLWTMARIR
jgi:hypothetical protein